MTTDRLARIEAHRQRIASERPQAERLEIEAAANSKAERRRLACIAQKRKASRSKNPWGEHWLKVIDRINAMARNPGWSL